MPQKPQGWPNTCLGEWNEAFCCLHICYVIMQSCARCITNILALQWSAMMPKSEAVWEWDYRTQGMSSSALWATTTISLVSLYTVETKNLLLNNPHCCTAAFIIQSGNTDSIYCKLIETANDSLQYCMSYDSCMFIFFWTDAFVQSNMLIKYKYILL